VSDVFGSWIGRTEKVDDPLRAVHAHAAQARFDEAVVALADGPAPCPRPGTGFPSRRMQRWTPMD
jgi:hypothetical protein